MKIHKSALKDFYYTTEHEWIDFQGAVAYIGLSEFKLIGFDDIQQLEFYDPARIKKRGDVIATVQFSDFQLDVRMPVDGKILDLNELLVNGEKRILLQQPETNGWIALIIPDLPDDRNDLLFSHEFHFKKLLGKILFTQSNIEIRSYCDAAIKLLKRQQVADHILDSFIENIIQQLEQLDPLKKNPQQWSNITSARVYFNRQKIY